MNAISGAYGIFVIQILASRGGGSSRNHTTITSAPARKPSNGKWLVDHNYFTFIKRLENARVGLFIGPIREYRADHHIKYGPRTGIKLEPPT